MKIIKNFNIFISEQSKYDREEMLDLLLKSRQTNRNNVITIFRNYKFKLENEQEALNQLSHVLNIDILDLADILKDELSEETKKNLK